MDFLFTRLFWGIVVVLLGLSIILSIFTKYNIPFFRIFFAMLLIYMGIRVLIGGNPFARHMVENGEETFVFSDSQAQPDTLHSKYNVIFSNQELDFTKIGLDGNNKEVELNVVFGRQKLYISALTNVEIRTSTAFAAAQMPDGNNSVLGETTWRSPGFRADGNVLRIKANVVFGALDIVIK